MAGRELPARSGDTEWTVNACLRAAQFLNWLCVRAYPVVYEYANDVPHRMAVWGQDAQEDGVELKWWCVLARFGRAQDEGDSGLPYLPQRVDMPLADSRWKQIGKALAADFPSVTAYECAARQPDMAILFSIHRFDDHYVRKKSRKRPRRNILADGEIALRRVSLPLREEPLCFGLRRFFEYFISRVVWRRVQMGLRID